jgi:integrase
MTSATHPLWEAPADDAPELERQAHELMMQTLKRIELRVPGILYDPGAISGEQVMREALAASTNPKIDADMRLAALSLLQDRMRSVDSAMPQRLFLLQAPEQSAIERTVGVDLADLAEFDRSLERFIVDQRPGAASGGANATGSDLNAVERAGLLLALLVMRLGHGSTAILGQALDALAAEIKPVIAGRWAWLDIEIQTTGSPELRRIFLDPATLAAWMLAAKERRQLSRPPEGYKAGRRRGFWRRLADNCFRALCRKMNTLGYVAPVARLKRLCHCEIQRLRMTTIPVLATYAEAGFSSSSLEPGTWCRLIGFRPSSDTGQVQKSESDAVEGDSPLATVDPHAKVDLREQLTAGDLADNSLINELRKLMTVPRIDWKAAFASLIERLQNQGYERQTEALVVGWLDYLANERKSKGKRLSEGSIRYYRGLLANRLLQTLPGRLSDLSADELEAAYTEVIMSRRSPGQTRHIQTALASFDQYVRAEHLPDLPPVTLPGFEGVSYEISSRIISEDEFQTGLRMIDQGAIVVPGIGNAFELSVFWKLAYRFGLRRTEILGLQRRDIRDGLLTVRINEARHLKTTNAHRVLPLSLIDGQLDLEQLCMGKRGRDYLFFDRTPSAKDLENHAVVNRAKQLLARVTGDERIHAHNLRHSTATLNVLGMLGQDLRLRQHPYAEPWMLSALDQAKKVDDEISGSLYRKGGRGNALAMMMGHGSELTTYEHYTHCFDLLLFISCWRGHFQQVKQPTIGNLFPPRHEVAQLLALLGLAPTTQVETQDIPRLLQRITSGCPDGVVALQVRESTSATAKDKPDSTEGQSSPSLTLTDLLQLPGATSDPGYLKKQSDRDSVAALLERFNAALPTHREGLAAALWQWVRTRWEDGDWALMPVAEARSWEANMHDAIPNIGLEVHYVYKDDKQKRKKAPIEPLDEQTVFTNERRRYYVRIADARGKVNRRKSSSGQQRSRSQRSITWFLLAFADHLGEPPREVLTREDGERLYEFYLAESKR